MTTSEARRGLVRCLGVTAAAVFALAASQQRAEALSLASPGTAPVAKYATDGLTTEVRHGGGGHGGGGFRGGGGGGFRGGGGGGFRGGGFHGGGFRGGGAAFHGGGFRGGGMAIHRGGFRAAPVYRGGGFRAARVYHGGGYRYGYRHAYHRPHFSPPASLPSTLLCCAGLLRLSVLLWLPAPLLPRGLDLLRAAQDLQIPSLVAPSPLRIPLLVRAKMKRRPVGRLFLERRGMRLINPNPCLARA